MAKPRHRALAIGLVSVLATGSVLAPVSASASISASVSASATAAAASAASAQVASAGDVIAIDRGADYQELSADDLAALAEADTEADVGDAAVAAGDAISLLSTARLSPVKLSDEMLYFAIYESGHNYDQGLSYGDGYNAMGYYQFDRRYALVPFITAVYNYNPTKYAMFKEVIAQGDTIINGAQDPSYPDDPSKKVNPFRDSSSQDGLSDLGRLVNNAWHAAYRADSAEFSALQDSYAYENYYKQAERIFRNYYGITIDNRADAVRGLAWGMCNLFGSGGMQKFIKAANINNAMTDREIATRLTNAIVAYYSTGDGKDHTYAAGYINRYRKEQKVVLGYVAEDERQFLGARYSDIDYGQWYLESIAWVAQRGFMSGLSGTTQMAPYGTTSRAMVVTMLCRVSGGVTGSVGSLAFPDVSRNEWYSGTIAWGVQNGLVSGYGDGTFRPDQDVTREEAAIFLMRYAQMRGLDTSARADLSAYPDDDEVSPWGAQAMSWAVATGIISGVDGHLNPQGTAYRCEFAAMLRGLCDIANI